MPCLFWTNKEKDRHNQLVFKSLPGPSLDVTAIDGICEHVSPATQKHILHYLKTKPATETDGLLYNLQLRREQYVSVVCNIDLGDKLHNGASGRVKAWLLPMQSDKQQPAAGVIFVQFDQAKVGKRRRHTSRHLLANAGAQPTWTPTWVHVAEVPASGMLRHLYVRRQCPLAPADGETVHKKQGQTEDRLAVDFSGLTRVVPALHYVALSRAKTLAGLYVINLHMDKAAADTRVLNELDRLKTVAAVQLRVQPPV